MSCLSRLNIFSFVPLNSASGVSCKSFSLGNSTMGLVSFEEDMLPSLGYHLISVFVLGPGFCCSLRFCCCCQCNCSCEVVAVFL